MALYGHAVNNRQMPGLNLSDGIVTLSPLCLEDVEAHLAGEDELLVRWLNGGPGTREGTEAYIRHCLEQWNAAGPLRAFGIRVGATGDVLAGTIDVRFAQPGLARGPVSVAYGLYPSWRGRGLATRAVRLICGYVASEGATEAVIQVEPENAGSAAVALRAGFTYSDRIDAEDGTTLDRYVRRLAAGTVGRGPR